jgi:hypothetical protein
VYGWVLSPECRIKSKLSDKSFENMAKFVLLGTAVTNQNYIHQVVKSRLNSGDSCYHSVQSLLSLQNIITVLK